MRSGLPVTLRSFGTVLLSFGLVFLIIELLAIRFGTPHDAGFPIAAGLLVGGAILCGIGILLGRSAKESTPAS